jgi:phytol kinase
VKRGDQLAIGGYGLTAATTLALAEWLRRRGVPAPLTRKLVHVVAGLSPLYVMGVTETKRVGVGLYGLTAFANAIFWRRGTFRALSSREGTPGIVYFALVQTLLLAWLWRPTPEPRLKSPLGAVDRASPYGDAKDASLHLEVRRRNGIALAALLTLALGDASAALIGERWGRHRYGVLDNQKSWEGSAAMLAVTLLVVGAALGAARLPQWWKAALAASATATSAEALSPRGLDNLTAPLAVALLLLRMDDG